MACLIMFPSLANAKGEERFRTRTEMVVAPWAELSGVVYDPLRNGFIEVGDEGDILIISREGAILGQFNLPGTDFEDVALDTDNRTLYILDESIPEIRILDADTFQEIRNINLRANVPEYKQFLEKAIGFEGLAYIKPKTGNHKARLIVSNQVMGKGKRLEERSGILSIDLEGKDALFIETGLRDCSGLAPDPSGDFLWALLDTDDELVRLGFDGMLMERFHIPGTEQEGIVWAYNGLVIVCEDGTMISGRIE